MRFSATTMLGPYARVLLGLKLLELLGDLGPRTAGDLMPPPRLPIRAVANRDRAIPAALDLVLVDRSFVAPTTPGASGMTTHDLRIVGGLLPYLLPDDHDRAFASL